jgi:hypothetical protein
VALTSADRLKRSGLVFQFPERHFLAATLQQVSVPCLVALRCFSIFMQVVSHAKRGV